MAGVAKNELFVVSPDKYVDFAQIVDGRLKATFEVINVHAGRIAFRIQTTSREDYSVKPATGFIDVGDRVLVTVTLRTDGNVSNKHAFLVHGLQVKLEESGTVKEFWEAHHRAVTYTWRLDVNAPEFEEHRLRDRLLTQVQSLRQTNADLRQQISNLQTENKMLYERMEMLRGNRESGTKLLVHFLMAAASIIFAMMSMNVALGKLFGGDNLPPQPDGKSLTYDVPQQEQAKEL